MIMIPLIIYLYKLAARKNFESENLKTVKEISKKYIL